MEPVYNLRDVSVAILAGGLGTRLRAVLPDRSKVLAEVRGKPFLAYVLAQLSEVGVRRVVLCTGYLGDMVKNAFGESYDDIELLYSREASARGTGGALRLALPMLELDPVLVMNGDSFCAVDLRPFWAWHVERKAGATILLAKVHDTARYGRVRLDAMDRIKAFEEKSTDARPGWVNAGVYLMSRSLIQSIPDNRAVSLEKEMFPNWLGKKLFGYRNDGAFIDIGTPEGYSSAPAFFCERQLDVPRSAQKI